MLSVEDELVDYFAVRKPCDCRKERLGRRWRVARKKREQLLPKDEARCNTLEATAAERM